MTPGAWRALQNRIRASIRGRVAKNDLDDVVQESLLRISRGLASVKASAAFHGWVTSVVQGTIVDHHRRRIRSERGFYQVELEAARSEEASEPSLLGHIEPFLLAFVELVSEPYREALKLTDLGGLTHLDASRRLGVPLSTMKSRVQRGRTQLREHLEACCAVSLDPRGQVTDLGPNPAWGRKSSMSRKERNT